MYLILFVVAVMLLSTPGAEARFYIDIPGVETNCIPASTPVVIKGMMDNNTGENVIGISNGIRIYSPAGVVWQTPTTTIGDNVATYFDMVTLSGFSVDGVSDDTIGVAAVASIPPGVPDGLTGLELFRIETGVSLPDVGMTICIDSSWFPPSYEWQWATPSGTVIPDWEGPYCYVIVQPLATIEGTVFDDVDGNGQWDLPTDTGMQGVTVNLTGTDTQTTTTDQDGEYSFTDLAAGTYRVYEDVPDGYVQTFPALVSYRFTTEGYEHLTDVDFGNTDATCEGIIEIDTCFAGTDDDFVGAEPSSPDAALLALMDMATNGANPYFDSACVNQSFGHTFSGCWPESCKVVGATLCMKLKATGSVPSTDKLYLGEWDEIGAFWAITMNNLETYAGGNGSWDHDDVMTVCIDLANMPADGLGGPQNLLGGLQDGRLDVLISDDTEVDYLELIVETCCEDTPFGGDIIVIPSGPGAGEADDTIYCDEPVTFDIHLHNYCDTIIMTITNGFRLYSPDGATWETPVYYSTGALEPYFDLGVWVNGFSVDGVSDDTITLGGAAAYNGIPNGFDDVVVKIETQFDAAQVGKTFCIDSTFFPPSGYWLWAYTGGSIIPDWGGPHCWSIAAAPSQDCHLYFGWEDDENDKFIYRTDLNGIGPPANVTPDHADKVAIALNPAANTMYWTRRLAGEIWRADLDGANASLVIYGCDYPRDIAVDTSGAVDMVYWIDEQGVRKAAVPYGTPTTVISISWFNATGIAVDPIGKYIYCTSHNEIWRKSLVEGAGPPKVVRSFWYPGRRFHGIDLDLKQHRMYWTDALCNEIYSASMIPNLGPLHDQYQYGVTLVCETGEEPGWIKVDHYNQILYWVEKYSPHGVWRVNYDGTNKEHIVGLPAEALALDLSCYDQPPAQLAGGDVDLNGISLSVGDLAYLNAFIFEHGPVPDSLYQADLNGDYVVDSSDVRLFEDYFIYGLSVFGPYGGYPVPTCDEPTPDPVEDVVTCFGLTHVSLGYSSLDTSGGALLVSKVDTFSTGEDGVVICLDQTLSWSGEIAVPFSSGPGSRIDFADVPDWDSVCNIPEWVDPFAVDIQWLTEPCTCITGPWDLHEFGFEGYKSGALTFTATGTGSSFGFSLCEVGRGEDGVLLKPYQRIIDNTVAAGLSEMELSDWWYCVDGQPVPGLDMATLGAVDEIRFFRTDPDYEVTHLTGVSITTSGIETLTITDEYIGCCQTRGDINHNGTGPDIADLVYLVNFMFNSGDGPPCLEECDVNGDGNGPDIADLVYLVNYMFNSGPEPVPCGEEAPPLLSKAGGVDPDISIELSHEDGFTIVTLNSPVDLRGVQLEMTGNGPSEPINLAGDHLDLVSGRDGITVKIGILDLDGGEIIMAGSNAIVRLDGDYSLESALVADMVFRSVTPSTVSSAKEASLPGNFVLNQNYPNPFNPTTQISFSLPNATDVRLEIFNVLGQRVTTLVDEAMEAGQHVVQWDGDKISSGVYFYRLTSDKNVETKKMMLLK